MFRSKMVNHHNYNEFVQGGDDRELVQRVIDRKKPFASVVSGEEDLELMRDLHNRAKRERHLVVSPLYLLVTHYNTPGLIESSSQLVFNVAQKGTLDELFDLAELARFYDESGYPEVANDIIIRKRHLKLSHYFKDWDWQQRCAKFSGSYARWPWEKPRNPPVEPWETGLILGYPPELTIDAYYWGDYYVYRPSNPERAIRDFLRKKEQEGGRKDYPLSRRKRETYRYKVIQPGKE